MDKKILDKNIFSQKGVAKDKSLLQRLRVAFPQLKSLEPFIRNFIKTTTATNKIMKILKNNGLSIATYNQCIKILKKLPKNSTIKKKSFFRYE